MTGAGNGLFQRLKADCQADWDAYIRHPFVVGLGNGSLPDHCFKHYLKQDYLFLVQFARCYALTAYKAHRIADIRRGKEALRAILDVELDLHVAYCEKWGIPAEALEDLPTDPANAAYTDYVMQVGETGGLLDLHVALAPCVVGYYEIGAWLAADPATVWDGNPYAEWINMYAGDEYRAGAADSITYLDTLVDDPIEPAEFDRLSGIFAHATRLEIGFWDMGFAGGQ